MFEVKNGKASVRLTLGKSGTERVGSHPILLIEIGCIRVIPAKLSRVRPR